MRGKMNTTGVKEGGEFEPIPEGTYKVSIYEVSPKTSKNNDPMAGLCMIVEGGDHSGRYVWDNIIFPEPGSPAVKIKGRTMHFLHCINEEYEGEFDWNTDNWIGKAVYINVKHEEYKGKVSARVSEYLLPEDSSKDAVEEDAVPF